MNKVAGKLALLAAASLIVGGCPQQSGTSVGGGVVARIGISATRGDAPHTVNVTAAESSSPFGEIVAYAWDFAGQAGSAESDAAHRFEDPGRYTIKLTVHDSSGNTGLATVDVRVQGGAVVAVIQADVSSGTAPLPVQFDGTASEAEGDEILDYFWDFGDGATSRRPSVLHVYSAAGTYTVALRVISAGGIEARTETVVVVDGAASASLQFAGGQFATLPLAGTEAVRACTFETWFKAEAAGGTLARVGGQALLVDVLPSESVIRVQVGGQSIEAAAADLTGAWRHLAVSYDGAAGGAVYLDGVSIGTLAPGGDVVLDSLTLGLGFQGKAAEARVWSLARAAADVVTASGTRLSGSEAGLMGNWRLNEGGGQWLGNSALGGADGTLGAGLETEASDPAWSSDGPPVR